MVASPTREPVLDGGLELDPQVMTQFHNSHFIFVGCYNYEVFIRETVNNVYNYVYNT